MHIIKPIFTLFIILSGLISAAEMEMKQMTKEQAYAILSQASGMTINSSSSEKDIKKSYRKALLKWHPDQNQANQEEATDKTKWINHANEILTGKTQPASSSSPKQNENSEENEELYKEEEEWQKMIDEAIGQNQDCSFILILIVASFKNNTKRVSNLGLSNSFGAKIHLQLAKLILEKSILKDMTIEAQLNTFKEAYDLAIKAMELNQKSKDIKDFVKSIELKKNMYEKVYYFFLKGKEEYNLRNNNTARYYFELFIGINKLENCSLESELEFDKFECFIELLIAKSKFYLGEIYFAEEDSVKQDLDTAHKYLSDAKKYFENPRIPKCLIPIRNEQNFNQYLDNSYKFLDAKTYKNLDDIEKKLKEIKKLRSSCVIQ